ncbi:MAG: hypothetical protein C5S40_06260 [ANME-2 cluster archaeon]|nr:hypothetical protein [ANME-2 cluster archaeon]
MDLLAEDIEQIGHILAQRYFTEQGWKFTDIRLSGNKIIGAVEVVNEQYSRYPYMSRDWYVENSAEKSFHLSNRWDKLTVLASLLQTCPDMFNFLLKINNNMSLCIVKTLQSDLSNLQENAITDARKSGFNVYIFRAGVPECLDFELEEVVGGISGRGTFR